MFECSVLRGPRILCPCETYISEEFNMNERIPQIRSAWVLWMWIKILIWIEGAKDRGKPWSEGPIAFSQVKIGSDQSRSKDLFCKGLIPGRSLSKLEEQQQEGLWCVRDCVRKRLWRNRVRHRHWESCRLRAASGPGYYLMIHQAILLYSPEPPSSSGCGL